MAFAAAGRMNHGEVLDVETLFTALPFVVGRSKMMQSHACLMISCMGRSDIREVSQWGGVISEPGCLNVCKSPVNVKPLMEFGVGLLQVGSPLPL